MLLFVFSAWKEIPFETISSSSPFLKATHEIASFFPLQYQLSYEVEMVYRGLHTLPDYL